MDAGFEPDAWVGRTLAELCAALGNPDEIGPAAELGVKLADAVPAVALTWRALGHRWLVSADARVLAAVRIKE